MGRTRFFWGAPWREGKEGGSEAKLRKEMWSGMGQARCSMATGLARAGDPSPKKIETANRSAKREESNNSNSGINIHT